VHTQIWTALAVYLLAAILKKTSALVGQPRHGFTDFEPHAFGENTRFAGPAPHSSITRRRKPPMFTGVLNRTAVKTALNFIVPPVGPSYTKG
jgi:hypothetical protein